MSPEVRERVFEPFFTTKEVGKGSGLGLSQVYGFVRQSDGDIDLKSEPGQGTTFTLRLRASAQPAEVADKAPAATIEGGDEHILLVEDDTTVLSLTTDMLTGLGYHVMTATNAAEAIAIVQSDARIDLLFSDVVMPGGVSGVTLGRTAREHRPDLRVLLTSGYIGDGPALHTDEFPLLDKPYATGALAGRLRKLLDAPKPRRRRGRGSGQGEPSASAAAAE
jgi:CheY-like chemotaxis protein